MHLYFEHRPLTAEVLDPLLEGLASAGLHLDGPETDAYPALSGFASPGGDRYQVSTADLELLLRSKEPPVGAGYGVLPFRILLGDLPRAPTFLTFSRHDRATGLDGVSLVIDGSVFARDEPAALDAAFEWFAVLCSRLPLLYGWADWETATFLVAAPSRRDVRAGNLPRLLRFNAVGPSLCNAIDSATVAATAPRFRRLENGVILFEA